MVPQIGGLSLAIEEIISLYVYAITSKNQISSIVHFKVKDARRVS